MLAPKQDTDEPEENDAGPDFLRALALAKSIRTPIQFASVAISLVLVAVIFKASIAVEAIQLVLVILPFVLLLLVFNGNTLERLRAGGVFVAAPVFAIVLGSFVPAILIASSTFSVGRNGIAGSSATVFGNAAIRKSAERAYNDNFRVRSYLDNYNLMSTYYSKTLIASYRPDAEGDAFTEMLSLRKQMDDMKQQIIAAKSGALDGIYGSEELKAEILKFERCQLDLRSMSSLWRIVMLTYGSEGETRTLDQIIDVKALPSDPALIASIPTVRYSQVESDLISAVGPAFVGKVIGGFDAADVDRIRTAFASLGYLGEASNARSSAEILRRFNVSLAQYLYPRELNIPMYKLAGKSAELQIAIYIALYDTGLLDFTKFVLKYSPERARPMVSDLFNREITLVDSADFDALSGLLIQQEHVAGKDIIASSVILFKLRDNFKTSVSKDPLLAQVLKARTAEDFLVQTLRASMNKQESMYAGEFFGRIGFRGESNPRQYDRTVQEMLDYYDVFESTVIANALSA